MNVFSLPPPLQHPTPHLIKSTIKILLALTIVIYRWSLTSIRKYPFDWNAVQLPSMSRVNTIYYKSSNICHLMFLCYVAYIWWKLCKRQICDSNWTLHGMLCIVSIFHILFCTLSSLPHIIGLLCVWYCVLWIVRSFWRIKTNLKTNSTQMGIFHTNIGNFNRPKYMHCTEQADRHIGPHLW